MPQSKVNLNILHKRSFWKGLFIGFNIILTHMYWLWSLSLLEIVENLNISDFF